MTRSSAPRRSRLVAASATGLLALVGTVVAGSPAAAGSTSCDTRNNNTVEKLLECVTAEGVMEHLDAFQAIADANGGVRASGTPGYNASADYVQERLEAAGYTVTRQEFTFPYYEQKSDPQFSRVSSPAQTFAYPGEFRDMTYSGSGTVEGIAVPIDVNSGTSGCEAADFPAASTTEPQVALVKRGSCTFGTKAVNAEAAGYDAIVVYNDGAPPPASGDRFGVVAGTLGAPVGIPALGTSNALGLALPGATVRIVTDTVSEIRTTANVFAERAGLTSDNIVMAGSHLDSVAAGPGINDNGSGSAGILEVAELMAKVEPQNTVRFAWWGAEELGLRGSNHYVASLNQAQKADIALYLNFDMIGSPNFARFIYDGDQSDFPAPVPVPAGSAQIEYVFEDFYEKRQLAYEGTEFSGRSDYQAFILNGIPSGGLFTGAEALKKPYQAAAYGGTAGVAFDPCYHQACDTNRNLDRTVLGQNADAVAYAVLTLAYTTESVNAVVGVPVPGGTYAGDPANREHRLPSGGLAGGGGLHPEHEHDHEGDAA